MEEEIVVRRRWVDRQRFLDTLAATNLVPGPNSTEMAIHLGFIRAGWPGLLLGGACFILPAFFLTLALAWIYRAYGTLPAAGALLYGIQPVVLAVVLAALWRLGQTAARTPWTGLLAAATFGLSLWGVGEIGLMFAAGALGLLRAARTGLPAAALAFILLPPSSFILHPSSFSENRLLQLGLFFLKIGSILFGSGYLLIAFLQGGLVHDHGWLTERQLLDAISVGQMTPGPVFTAATFIGYQIAGVPGALAATAGIFLPAFVVVALTSPVLPRLRRSRLAAGFLDGVNAGGVGLMAAVLVTLGRAALTAPPAVLIAILSAAALLWTRVNSVYLILAGGVVGYLIRTVFT
jgi:chromate transporter